MRNIFILFIYIASFAGAVVSGVAMVASLFPPFSDGAHFVECAVAFILTVGFFFCIRDDVEF
jgi:hypothetical protein